MASDDVKDLVQIGLTTSSNERIKDLVELPFFTEEQDVYRLAVAVAIGRDMKPARIALKDFSPKWRVADDASSSSGEGERLDDRDKTFANMITTFYPDVEDPYRQSQSLAVPGINFLHQELCTKHKDLSEVLPSAIPPADE